MILVLDLVFRERELGSSSVPEFECMDNESFEGSPNCPSSELNARDKLTDRFDVLLCQRIGGDHKSADILDVRPAIKFRWLTFNYFT